ncbi:duf1446 domain containing protein [Moniliophthora roreri MCA 2997]|uniref:Duf1446 domain containing protein n=2 Tax=Moniliophthora roreri TaxID=221103 RepID=V2WX09_MONRO|nr:duf1446 domain containing protein [Moniliophthora roreri MCA 2997]KAI3603423.1 duf1446 domain containing protein [Moniliophthora roreri]
MSPSQTSPGRRPIRIGNSSGYTGDGIPEMYRLVTDGPVDAICADYLAEMNIPWRALEMMSTPELGYEVPALSQLKWMNAAEEIAKQGIKVVHDGGALNPYGLYKATKEYLAEKGLGHVKVAWVEGDNVKELVQAEMVPNPTAFPHLDIQGLDIGSLKGNILSANAYTGMRGIVTALNAGAQIVICGRCCDASPLMGLAAWWHGWSETDYDQLAGALVAGHITECGPYVTGGNFCGFKAVPGLHKIPGYPIAEIAADGTAIITKHEGTHGAVTVDTVTAQLVYEIQGPKYLNPDVVALLENIRIELVGKNRVGVYGVTGMPPPPTTKLAICTLGGYQSENTLYAVGLDIKEKVDLQKAQLLGQLDSSKYTKISIETHGTCAEDPQSQNDATVSIRHFVQAPTKEAIVEFWKTVACIFMGGYCGGHMNMDARSMAPKPYVKLFPALIAQDKINIKVHLEGEVLPVESVKSTAPFTGQESYPPKVETNLSAFSPTRRAPLGKVVCARSGDKAGNANVGLWVRNDDEWPWLQSFLTIERFKHLVGKDYKPEYRIERFEMPHIRAVHFVTYGILEGGVSSSSIVDQLAKSFGEFIRARHVDLPVKFLERPAVGEYLH